MTDNVTNSPLVHSNEEELRRVVTEGMETALIRMGFDVKSPLEMQADLQHLRRWRKTTDAVQRQGIIAATGLFVTGLLAALWLGIRAAITGGH